MKNRWQDELRRELADIKLELARLEEMTTGRARELCGQLIDRLSSLG